jgi:hypothetical protein
MRSVIAAYCSDIIVLVEIILHLTCFTKNNVNGMASISYDDLCVTFLHPGC